MDPLVSTTPTPWLEMEKGLRSIAQATRWLTVIALILVAFAFLAFVSSRVVDFTWVAAMILVFALRGVNLFCQSAMERIRQLGQAI